MKEDIKPRDGKRKLYFSIDLQHFITYSLDANTTCRIILDINKSQIESKLIKLQKNSKVDLSDYDFYLIDLKEIKKSQGYFLSRIKLNRNIQIFNFLQNPKTILCFLPKIQNENQNLVNNKSEYRLNIDNEKLKEMKKNYLNDKQVENFFVNKTIFLYDFDTKIYNKLKGNLSEKQFTIHGKPDTIIYIQDIASIQYCDMKNPIVEALIVKSGFKPPFNIILKTDENQWILGLKNEQKLNKWRNGFNFVFINLNFFKNDINFRMEMNDLKNAICQKEKEIINTPFDSDNFLKNKFKKKLFYKHFPDKKIAKLVDDIFIYKEFIKNSNFNQALIKLNEILQNNKDENKNTKSKIGKIITDEKISKLKDIYNKANDIMNEENKVPIKELLKDDLFNDIFEELNKLYISPFLIKYNEEINDLEQINSESNLKKSIESLMASNCLDIYDIKNIDSLLDL